jgi:hypothetical protein
MQTLSLRGEPLDEVSLHQTDGAAGAWQGEEAQQNYALLRGNRCFACMENATHRLLPEGLRPNYHHWAVLGKRKVAALRNAA